MFSMVLAEKIIKYIYIFLQRKLEMGAFNCLTYYFQPKLT